MTSRTWHKGPPPHIGWWNASILRNSKGWRWWDGKQWSLLVIENDSLDLVEEKAKSGALNWTDFIEWTDYYPKNACVPRINPGENK